MSRSGCALRRDLRREVGSGSGRAMRRCSFAGPPPIVVDVLGVGCWVLGAFPWDVLGGPWIVRFMKLRTGVCVSPNRAKITPNADD